MFYPCILIINKDYEKKIPWIYKKLLNLLINTKNKALYKYKYLKGKKQTYTKYVYLKKEYNELKKQIIDKELINIKNIKLILDFYIIIINIIINRLNKKINNKYFINSKIKVVNIYYNYSWLNKVITFNFILDNKIKVLLKNKIKIIILKILLKYNDLGYCKLDLQDTTNKINMYIY